MSRVRFLRGVFVFVVAFVSGDLFAANCGPTDVCHQGQAYAACYAALQHSLTYPQGATPLNACTPTIPSGARPYFTCLVTRNGYWNTSCYAPGTQSGQSQYYYSASCASKELEPSIILGSASGKACFEGCVYERGDARSVEYELGALPSSVIAVALGWKASGATCAGLSAPPAPKTDDECVQEGSLTQCIKKDGQHCATASTGKQFCWATPSDDNTPDKTDGTDYGTRNPDSGKPPSAPPSGGGDWNPPSGCGVMSRTVNGTKVTYFVCGGGGSTPPTTPPTDPPAGTDPCDPTKETCTPGSAGGGEGCDAAPSCSGDPINCAILAQSWRARCSANGNKAGGDSCTPEGSVAGFACSGDQILCKQALTSLEARCMALRADHALRTDAGDGVSEDGDPLDAFIPDAETDLLSGSRINLGGGALFPTVVLPGGGTWTAPAEIYSVLNIIRLLVIAACTYFAITRIFR